MKLYITFFLALFSIATNAQTNFLTEGKIFFEKKTNQYKAFEKDNEEEGDGEWIKELKKTIPKMVTDNYVLQFNSKKSLFKLKEENTEGKYLWNTKPSETDVTIQNIETNALQIQREVFEETYIINDSARKMQWKITGETRTIAGFNCKKAVGKICDSVYVVAFYCDDILTQAGPESFGGLPGMILGLAIPRLGTTYFATKVEIVEPNTEIVTPKMKGKKVNFKGLNKEMEKALEDWGNMGKINMWKFNL